MTVAEAMQQWVDRSCWDGDGYDAPDWADPVEVLAITLYLLGFAVPEDAKLKIERPAEREWMSQAWTYAQPSDRHLYRRRAIVALDAMHMAEEGALL